ncbi:MAG: mechanosensitive ion channel family protein, partial [Bacteroidales bacterium]|nr:mechanosensitive ion channel family protein [Bacteroidales bacterium]
MFYWVSDLLRELLNTLGIGASYSKLLIVLIITSGLIFAGFIFYYVFHRILCLFIRHSDKRRPSLWKKTLLKEKFFTGLSVFIPVLIINKLLPHFFHAGSQPEVFLSYLISIITIVSITYILTTFMRSFSDILLQKEATKDKPVKSYAQIIIIIFWVIAVILIISVIIGKSPVGLLAGLGAFSAVLLLVFQDTITGFVYSIQLASNDLVRNGDWITMSRFGADGTVEEINLISVKVRNFDNTISTIPVKQLIADSFQNWRGMQEQGMRRIKRSFNVDVTSIRICSDEMITQFKQIAVLKKPIEQAEQEIANHNAQLKIDTSLIPNGRHLTNVGILRLYIVEYLKQHPRITQQGTLMVRQLEPSEYGLP